MEGNFKQGEKYRDHMLTRDGNKQLNKGPGRGRTEERERHRGRQRTETEIENSSTSLEWEDR